MDSDQKLIEAMADLWIQNGGDAEGIAWCWMRIREAVEKKLEESDHD